MKEKKSPDKRIAVYAGSFDPLTNGHLDIIKRAVKLFDWIIVAVVDNPNKKPLFTSQERMDMIRISTAKIKTVTVMNFSGLLVDFMEKIEAGVLIRGLREISDFEYEFQMALMNRKLNASIETVFLMPAEKYTYLSSSVVKEVAKLGGDVKDLVPKVVLDKLNKLKKHARISVKNK